MNDSAGNQSGRGFRHDRHASAGSDRCESRGEQGAECRKDLPIARKVEVFFTSAAHCRDATGCAAKIPAAHSEARRFARRANGDCQLPQVHSGFTGHSGRLSAIFGASHHRSAVSV